MALWCTDFRQSVLFSFGILIMLYLTTEFFVFFLKSSSKISNILESARKSASLLIFFQNQHKCWEISASENTAGYAFCIKILILFSCKIWILDLYSLHTELESKWKVESFKRKVKRFVKAKSEKKNWKSESRKQKFYLYHFFITFSRLFGPHCMNNSKIAFWVLSLVYIMIVCHDSCSHDRKMPSCKHNCHSSIIYIMIVSHNTKMSV